jgi:hypothetical protein
VATPGDINVVAHVIQQAVAPVFLLTGVGAILGVLTNRLARVVDRFRTLEDEMLASGDGVDREHHNLTHRKEEMRALKRRRAWIHRAITLITVCALLICVVIAILFLGSEMGIDPSRVVGLLFISAMVSLILGLLCFLREIAIATREFAWPS